MIHLKHCLSKVGKFLFVEMSSTPTPSIVVRPPEEVRGMKQLNKDKFSVSFDFPVLEFDSRDAGLISRRVRLEPYLIGQKLKPLKPVCNSEVDGKKYLVFNPEKVVETETKETIMDLLKHELGDDKVAKLSWKVKSEKLSFDNWDTKTIIRAILPDNLDFSSHTQTGHIVHCNFKDDILPFRFVIAEVLLNKIHQCRTVVQKGSIITNVFRNLDLELLAGEENYVTELKEGGIRFKLDFSKVYWNSRLSNEHSRLINKFNKESLVYDACCGIGPFVLPAFKSRNPRRIVANDLNPDSVKWLKVNIDLNKIKSDNIEVHNLDAALFIKTIVADDVVKKMKASTSSQKNSEAENENDLMKSEVHVVMNLPAYAVNFLPAFRGVLQNKIDDIPDVDRIKWNVYCYLFAKSHVDVDDGWYEKEARRMCDAQTSWNKSLVVGCHNVRTVSSRKIMFCVHLELPYDYLTANPLSEEELQKIHVGPETEEEEEPANKKART